MKLKFFIISILFLSSGVFAQNLSSLKITSPEGLKFKVQFDKKAINQEFSTEVLAENLDFRNYTIQIEFENSSIAPIKDAIEVEHFSNSLYSIKQKKNGSYKLKFEDISYYRTKTSCAQAIDAKALAGFENVLRSEPNDLVRKTKAEEIMRGNCLTFAQVKNLASLIENESTRLMFLQYSYFYVYDPQNYFLVNSLLNPAQQLSYKAFIEGVK